MKESLVVNACIRWLHLHGCFVWRNNTGGFKTQDGQFVRFGLKGSADLIGLLPGTSKFPGRFLAVEVKSEKGRLRPEQQDFGDKVIGSGGVYIVARSLDELEREVKPLL